MRSCALRRRSLVFWGLLTILLLPATLWGQAPERTPPLVDAEATAELPRVSRSAPLGSEAIAAPEDGIGRPLAGAALGAVTGVLAGAALGYVTGPRDDVPDGCMFVCVPSGPATGAAIGALIGPGIGAHLLNQRRGNPWAAVAGSLVGTVSGIALGLVAGGAAESTGIGLAVGVSIGLGAPALAEWITAR